MKVLVTGAGGQLGRSLCASSPREVELVALDHAGLDLTDAPAVAAAVARANPDWIVNAAAYTAVDRAEDERAIAFAVNAEGVRHLAQALQPRGGRLLQVSTDFVFGGGGSHPYRPADPVDPVNAYGASKAAGERAIGEILPDRHLIVRSAWLYDRKGRNFLTAMLRRMNEHPEVPVVDDQIGTPTHVPGLARVLWQAMARGLSGIHHWTDAGVASWYDFACAIRELAGARGLVPPSAVIRPIPSARYPARARRPAFSVLDKSETWERLGSVSRHWRAALAECLGDESGPGRARGT